MGTTNINQLMSDMRHLVLNLQNRERAADAALSKSQLVNEKISGMKEYQEKVANMNGCWRMQGRKGLLAGLQQENRQILQLQRENRELRQTLEDYETTLRIVMQKHRMLVTCIPRQSATPIPASSPASYEKNDSSKFERIVQLVRVLDDCFIKGEEMSNHDHQIIAKLTTENACLRNLLNIASRNDRGLTNTFLKRTSKEPLSANADVTILSRSDCSEAVTEISKIELEEGKLKDKQRSNDVLDGSAASENHATDLLSSSPL